MMLELWVVLLERKCGVFIALGFCGVEDDMFGGFFWLLRLLSEGRGGGGFLYSDERVSGVFSMTGQGHLDIRDRSVNLPCRNVY